ncbi:MAG: PAS domain S-box protein [Planctomycetota bacterium]
MASFDHLLRVLDEGFCLAVLIEDAGGVAVDYRFLHVNPTFEEMTGLVSAEGRTARELVPGLEPIWVERYAEVARGQSASRFEAPSAAMGRWFDVFAAPMGDGKHFALVFRDISKRKSAELALADSEERFHTLADHMSQLAWMADRNGSIFWFNRRWCEYTGTTQEEMQGWGWTSVHHPDHVDRVVARIQEAWETGAEFEDTFPLRGADGGYRWFLSRALPIRDANGEVLRWLGTNTDVTEQRNAEEALRARTNSLRIALRSAEAGDWCMDLKSGALQPSPELCALLGLHASGPTSWRRIVHPDDLKRVQAEYDAQLASTSSDLALEFRCLHPRHGVRWMESHGTIERDASGRAIECHGITLNITERKLREVRMQTAMAELNHRVKNTLGVVQSIARRTMRRAPNFETFRRSFEERLRSIAKANTLLTNSEWEGASLREIVHSELHARLASEGQAAIIGERAMIPPNVALGLHMVIHEWATNAAKYGALRTPAGQLHVEWSVALDPHRAAWLTLKWREDFGREVLPIEREGFGSQLVAQIVEHELSGSCERSLTPVSLDYTLSIPLAESEVPDTRSAATDAGTGARLRVLLVEDRAALAFGLRDELELSGFEVVGPAGTLARAQELASSVPFGVALLDLDLAGESSAPLGRELLDRGVRVILLTGYGPQDIPEGLGAARLLSKPVDMDELLAVLDPERFGPPSSDRRAAAPGSAGSGATHRASRIERTEPGRSDRRKLAHDVRNTFATLRLAIGALKRASTSDSEAVASIDEDLRLLYAQLQTLLEDEPAVGTD